MKVVLQDLTKIFPARKKGGTDTVAVDHFTYEIPDGKLIGLLGPSGCGKSTTLYMISGLQTPTEGKFSSEIRMSPPCPPSSGAWGWCSRTMRCTPT